MIRSVIALGVLSALVTVGQDVMEPEDEGIQVASSAGAPGADDPVAGAPVQVTPPTNGSAEAENASRPDGAAACGLACEGFLL